MKNIKSTTLSIVLGLVLAAGITYAWTANWHDPATWVSNGSVIQADKLGESLQYLYDRDVAQQSQIDALQSGTDGADGADGASAPAETCSTALSCSSMGCGHPGSGGSSCSGFVQYPGGYDCNSGMYVDMNFVPRSCCTYKTVCE